ncbi:MAG: pyridoxal phosphate-dependent aminotransferase [Planctomycetota bacterium]|nr:MAG: pyridoxal phosphate-dependent aminotransferase [Planctomycetota bacterium]
MNLASRMSRLGTETAFEVLARARALEAQGRNVVHLEIGEPDFETPPNIVTAAKQALDDGFTHYGPSAGLPALREAIAADFSRRRGVDVGPERVVVFPGGKPVMFFMLLALLEQGDEAIYPNPGFPIYESMINFSGATSVPLPLRQENEFRADVDELAALINDRTKVVIINSPQNPTGSLLTSDDLKAIAKLCADRGIWLLSDEIYSRLVYEGQHDTPLRYGDPARTVVLDGFSKTYAMTGWRLGYCIASEEFAVSMARLQTNATSCTAAMIQMAGVEALSGPQDAVDTMLEEFRARRTLIVDGLNAIDGISCVQPKGAFYVFPDITGTGLSSKELENRLLSEAGVACLSGTSFGAHAEGFLRFSYANSQENIREALRRVEGFLAGVQV